MKIEVLPLIIGVLVALLGVGILFDAWTPEVSSVSHERRRRPRVERHRNGEASIGFGVLALAAAFIGRDSWRYSTLVVLVGAVFLVVGAILNRAYLRELVTNRGVLRRRVSGETTLATPPPNELPEASANESAGVAQVATASDASVASDWQGPERRKAPRGTRGGRGLRRGAGAPRNPARDEPPREEPRP
jgi:hypothetical protein